MRTTLKGIARDILPGGRKNQKLKETLAAAVKLLEEEVAETNNLKMQIATFEAGVKP